MRGLIEKDLRVLAKRKQYFLMFAGIALILAFTMDDTFIISYVTMIGMVLAISTISYDEADNGLMFIMTLPVSRKQYAIEKHLFGYCTIVISWILGLILQVISSFFKGTFIDISSIFPGALTYLGVFCLILSVMVPIEIHFGMEKSRLAIFGIFGVCFAVGVLGSKITAFFNIDLAPAAAKLSAIPAPVLVLTGSVALVLILSISIFLTIKSIEKKEF